MPTPGPQPTQLKILKGNPGKQALPVNEPQPDVPLRAPKPPAYLKGTARREWTYISKKLHRLGLLTDVDTRALGLYCQAFGRWVDAQKEIDKNGLVVTTPTGFKQASPFVSISEKAMLACFRYLTAFGMTPSSRANVTVAKQGPKSKFSGLIAGGSKKK